MDIEIKKEIAIEAYQKTFDKEMAYVKAELSAEEIVSLDLDQEFQARLTYFLVLKREELVSEFWNLVKSPDEKIKLRAIIEMGPLIYPTFFNRSKGDRKPISADEVLEFFVNELNKAE